MYPGHLEIGNRETELIAAPRLQKSAEFGTVEQSQWNPPTTTKGKQAKLYSIESYYSQDRSPRAYCLWLCESILFVCLFWFCVLSFILQPPWNLLLEARNQLVGIQNTSTLIDTFDILITPFSVTSTFLYIIIGIIPLILIISSWNIGLRVTKDVTYRNFALHIFVMFICIATLISTLHLNIVINNFEEERIQWMIQVQSFLGTNLLHSQTFLGKLEVCLYGYMKSIAFI
uniref:Uncharacterized protein n=1 Tax=Panagrolaimus davidi TaxID=227884 RepID=A0A914QWZ6_9BILA